MCLLEKIGLLDKLCSGMSYTAIGCEFNVNESITWYIQKKEEEMCQSICEPTPERTKETSIVCEEAMERWKRG